MESPRRPPDAIRRGRLCLVAVCVGLTLGFANTASAQNIGIVRDAETEALLQDYLKPIFKAAGIPAGQVQAFIVPSDDFNAFVIDNQHMFVNSGAIIQSDTPNELIGVLAHESGHIKHQDNSQMQQALSSFGGQIYSNLAQVSMQDRRLFLGAMDERIGLLDEAHEREGIGDRMYVVSHVSVPGCCAIDMNHTGRRLYDVCSSSIREAQQGALQR